MGRSELDILLIEKLQRENQSLGRLYANTKKELEEAREVFVDLLDFVAGYRRAQMKMDQIIGETRTDSARLVSRDAAISDIQEQLQAAVLAAKGEKDG